MSLTGDLEHLPIVDVIQLMNSTRKSGVLSVRGRKGECQLVFTDGFIVSASFLNNSVRIGEVLVERGAVSPESISRALEIQSQAGSERKPLVMTLLDIGVVEQKEAYAGLQSLIERTIVEILTWKKGNFVLESNLEQAPDRYKYDPQNLSQQLSVDTQGVLMDALRIFDEKVRDGEIDLESESDDELEITADDLGLSDIEHLERKIPGVYLGLDDRSAAQADSAAVPKSNLVRRLNEAIAALSQAKSPPELALIQLRFVAEVFPRALTLIVSRAELIAEKAIGIKAARDQGPTAPLGFRIPFSGDSVLRRTVQSGELYCGPGDDTMAEHLFSRIASPGSPKIILLPVQCSGKTVFMTYADFGDGDEDELSLELLKMLCDQSGASLTELLRRKRPVKSPT